MKSRMVKRQPSICGWGPYSFFFWPKRYTEGSGPKAYSHFGVRFNCPFL